MVDQSKSFHEPDSLDAGLGVAFGADDESIQHNLGRSVLASLGRMTKTVPQVLLSEPAYEEESEPIVQPAAAKSLAADASCRYRIDGEIAQGGMGRILKGRDTDLGRDLAVKVLLDKHRDRPEVIQRFVEEAQIGGQLQHPGIAPIYELGQFADQRPYFTMKLVKGKTLAALLEAREDLAADRAKFIGIFEQVCQTMAYAHSRGVIHRDLKPANIMVGAFGEVQVMDWGLAKVLSSGGVADEKRAHESHFDQSIIETLRSSGSETPAAFGSQTQMGSVMGTPAYMPPEQALGEIDQLDQRADVFGLGAILCEILTGKPPYVAADHVQVFRLATRGKLEDCLARLTACGADPELVKLAKQCLTKEPADRPRDAGILSDRLSKHQQAVETRLREAEIGRAAQTAKAEEEQKRRRVSLALAASILALIITVGGGGLWLQVNKTASAQRVALSAQEAANAASLLAEQEKENADNERAANEKLRWVLYKSDIRRAQTEIQQGNYNAAKEILAAHVPQAGQKELRGFEWHYLVNRCPTASLVKEVHWNDDVPKDLNQVFSTNGNHMAAVIALGDGSSQRELAVWNVNTGEKEWSIELGDSVLEQVKLNGDGTQVGALFQDHDAPPEIRIWDTGVNQQVTRIVSSQIADNSEFVDFEFCPSNSSIAIACENPDSNQLHLRSIHLWNTDIASLEYSLPADQRQGMSFSPDGSKLAIVVQPMVGTHDASGTPLRAIQVVEAASGKLLKELHCLSARQKDTCTFSPDGKYVAMSAGDDTRYPSIESNRQADLLIWNVASGALQIAAPLAYGSGEITFSPSGDFVANAPGVVGSIEVFRMADGAPLLRAQETGGGVVRFSRDEKSVVVRNPDGTVRSWPLNFNKFDLQEYSFLGHADSSGDGNQILRIEASWKSPAGKATLFDVDGTVLRSVELPWSDHWGRWKLNHDGSLAINARSFKTAQNSMVTTKLMSWGLNESENPRTIYQTAEDEQLLQWAVSPVGAQIAALVRISQEDRQQPFKDLLRLLDENGTIEHEMDLEGAVPAIHRRPAFADGGVVGKPIQGRMTYSENGKAIGVFTRTSEETETAPNKGAADENGLLSVFDTSTGECQRRVSVSPDLHSFRFSHDLKHVAGSGGKSGFIEIWNIESGQLISTFVARPGTHLTFSPDSKRLLLMKYESIKRAVTHDDVLEIYDVMTGDQLLKKRYYGLGGTSELRFLPGRNKALKLGYAGRPIFWDGTPVELSEK